MNLLTRLFCKDKINELERAIESRDELIKSLEIDNAEMDSLKLKVKCQQMYIDDDEAILELIEMSVKNSKIAMIDQRAQYNQTIMGQAAQMRDIAMNRQAGLQGLMGAGRVTYDGFNGRRNGIYR